MGTRMLQCLSVSFLILSILITACSSQRKPQGGTQPGGQSVSGAPATTGSQDKIAQALAQLSEEDRRLAEQQQTCPVSGEALGSMGVPVKVSVAGRDVFICCEGCRGELTSHPEKYLISDAPGAAQPAASEGSASKSQ
jgi:hypothetical protein